MTPIHPQDSPSNPNRKGRDLYYVQRSVDTELLNHCQNARPTYILQSPQMGKTSLIAHTIEQLNATTHEAVHIDLSQFPLAQREEDWFYNIVQILDDQLDLSTDAIAWWSKPSVFALPPYIRLTKLMTEVILPEMTVPIVLFIDEIERTMTLPFRDHFFEWLTSLYESRATNSILYRISFVISGVASPSQLIPEGGPLLFQWSHHVVLSDFTTEETRALAGRLSFHEDDTEEIAEWVYKWTNGHPYLTQLLFKILEEQHRTVWLEKEVDECIQGFIMSPQGQHEPHIQFIRTALTEPDANGVNLLGAYLNLLKGKTENLKTNQTALEQLRLIGIIRANDADNNTEIVVRNALYQEFFSLNWVKRHLFPQGTVTSSPASQARPWYVTALQPSNLRAASLLLVGIGLLAWLFSLRPSEPLVVTEHNESSLPIETPLISKQTTGTEQPSITPEALSEAQNKIEELEATIVRHQNLATSEMANPSHNQKAYAEAQEKIQELETTIARYQDLSANEVKSLVNQRTLLEIQLASKDDALSTLQTQMDSLSTELQDQEHEHDKAIADHQTERAQLVARSTTAIEDLERAHEEVKTLQLALLKKSSLDPSEINQLIADRSQLDAQLHSASSELVLAHDRTRELKSLLTQEKQVAQAQAERHMETQANLDSKIRALQATITETRQALTEREETAQEQASLARTELSRLRHDRTAYQERLATSQQELSASTTQIIVLKKSLTQKDRAIKEEQQASTQLQTQLTQAQRDLNSATTKIANLGDQLSTAGMHVAQNKKTLEAIHTSSSEHNRRAEEKATKLALVSSTLKSQLQEKQTALLKAQEHIDQLTENAATMSATVTNLRATKKERDRFAQKLQDAEQQLAEAQSHIQRTQQQLAQTQSQQQDTQQQIAKAQTKIQGLEQSLRTASSKAQNGGTDSQRSVTSDQSIQSDSAREGNIVKVVSRITAKLAQSPSPIHSKTAKLLWARQAYEMNLQTPGAHWSTIDRSLRDGLHASPIKLKGVSSKIHTLTFDPSGDHVIAGTSDGKMLVWDMNQPLQSPKTFTGHTASVLTAAVSPDGQYIASGSLDSTIRLWEISDPASSPRILQAHQKGATTLAFRPDGKELASGSQDHTIRLWDLTSEQLQPVTLGTHAGRVNAIAYTPDGKTLISGGDDLALRVWDIQRKDSPPKILRGHRQSIASISIHPVGWMVATGSRDRKIGLWDLRQSLASPTFLSGSRGRVSHIQFSTDGSSLASVSSDKSLRIWNWQEPDQPPIQFPGHKGTLEAMAISPDGRMIAVGGSGQNVTLWTGTGQLAHTVCDTARENLSFSEWKQIAGENIPYERTCPNLPLHPTFLEEGKKLARQGAHKKAREIFERARQLDPYLQIDLDTEMKKLSAKLSSK